LTAHNWWQLKVALEKDGWIEVLTFEDRMLYFQHRYRTINRTIGYEKSNKMTKTYILKILAKVGIEYEAFVESYSQETPLKSQ
jgi:hypothetical protein